jgi:hypothetical protein
VPRSARLVTLAAATALALTGCSSGSSNASAPTTVATTTTTVPLRYSARVTGEHEVGALYRQGVARVDNGWVFSFNDGLFVTDNNFKQTKALQPAIPKAWTAKGFDHIGDIDVEAGVIYVPLEQPKYDELRQAFLMYDAQTLAYKGGVDVHQHEASFVTVDPGTGIAYTMFAFDGNALLRYDTRDQWRPLPPLKMSRTVQHVQGADVARGAVWLSTDDATDGVYRVDLATGKTEALGSVGHVDGEGEGIDATPVAGNDLHVLSIDVKVVPVRLVDLQVTATPVAVSP